MESSDSTLESYTSRFFVGWSHLSHMHASRVTTYIAEAFEYIYFFFYKSFIFLLDKIICKK